MTVAVKVCGKYFCHLKFFRRQRSGLALDNIGEEEPNENRVFRCLRRHCRPFVTDINKVEYGDGRSTSSGDALSAIAMRFIDEYFSLFAAWTVFRLIYFRHERTSEKTIFVRFYFILCFLTLTGEVVRAEALKSNDPEFQPDSAHHLFIVSPSHFDTKRADIGQITAARKLPLLRFERWRFRR